MEEANRSDEFGFEIVFKKEIDMEVSTSLENAREAYQRAMLEANKYGDEVLDALQKIRSLRELVPI